MPEEDPGPVVQRLLCGERARQWRQRRGIELADADARLGKYRGKLSKIETGLLAPKADETETLIELYGLSEAEAQEFRDLAAAARRKSASSPAGYAGQRYVSLEREASEIRMAYSEIPGLLQTRDYAEAALGGAPMVAEDELAKLAEGRAERSRRMAAASGQNVLAVIGEAALHYLVGGSDVLRQQIEWLATLAELPHVRLRIFPFTAGMTAALSCPFTLLDLPSPERRLAYVETLTGTDYIKAAKPYVEAFEFAWSLAAEENKSREIVARRILELS